MKLAQINFGPLEDVAAPEFAGKNIGDIVSALVPWIFAIAGFLLIIYLLYGGYQYLLSGGDPKSLEKAKSVITTAIIGFVIVFISFWLVEIILRILGLTSILSIF